MANTGKVWLVGAGPGDPELLTLRAVRAIGAADVLLVDDLVNPAVLAHAAPGARCVQVGKRGGCRSTSQAFIERLMVAEAQAGRQVVRLKGGDPFVFGRGGEERACLIAAGVDVEVINGISSGLAAPSSIGVPLTHRDWSAGAIFVAGHERGDAHARLGRAGAERIDPGHLHGRGALPPDPGRAARWRQGRQHAGGGDPVGHRQRAGAFVDHAGAVARRPGALKTGQPEHHRGALRLRARPPGMLARGAPIVWLRWQTIAGAPQPGHARAGSAQTNQRAPLSKRKSTAGSVLTLMYVAFNLAACRHRQDFCWHPMLRH